jgi:hypothetical protein
MYPFLLCILYFLIFLFVFFFSFISLLYCQFDWIINIIVIISIIIVVIDTVFIFSPIQPFLSSPPTFALWSIGYCLFCIASLNSISIFLIFYRCSFFLCSPLFHARTISLTKNYVLSPFRRDYSFLPPPFSSFRLQITKCETSFSILSLFSLFSSSSLHTYSAFFKTLFFSFTLF